MTLTVERRFTDPSRPVAQLFSWEWRDCGARPDCKRKVLCPQNWSQNACDVLSDKYLRKAGLPTATESVQEDGVPERLWRQKSLGGTAAHEHAAFQAFHRIAGFWAYSGIKQGHFDADNALAFYDEMFYMLASQMGAPNSPQFFNSGLWWAYGIEGEGHEYYKFDYIKGENGLVTQPSPCIDGYSRPQAGACYIQSVEDDLTGPYGIMDLWTREARAFKYGGGSGSNMSKLRGMDEPLSGGGKSSGLLSWLEIGDRAAGAIKSAGTTRRAALMRTVDLDHPDIMEFINWKPGEEAKVACLVAGYNLLTKFPGNKAVTLKGNDEQLIVPEKVLEKAERLGKEKLNWDIPEMDLKFTGEAYGTVSGQNSNNSVRVTNAQMLVMLGGGEIELKWRTDGRVCKTIPGKELWNAINKAGWLCADPGLQFHDTVNEWNTCPNDGEIKASNPCVTGDTLVLTKEGSFPIAELAKDGKQFLVWTGESWEPTVAKVTGENKPVFKVTIEDGRSVVCTSNHRFLWDVNTGMTDLCDEPIELKHLKVGDTLVDYPTTPEGTKRIVKIKSIKDAGIADVVYCFTEPKTGRGTFNGIVTGQCSEYMHLDDTACNLASLNLVKFQKEDGKLDADLFSWACRLWTFALDITVGFSSFPSYKIAKGSGDYRTLGLGYSNLGAAIMRRGFPYDCDASRSWSAAITALMHFSAGCASAEMARELGAFPRFSANKDAMMRVVDNHQTAVFGENGSDRSYIDLTFKPPGISHTYAHDDDLMKMVEYIGGACTRMGSEFGYRNAQWTLLAPTGTIGLVMDCDTTGIEPDFALVKHKTLVGGGEMTIVNQSVLPALQRLGYEEGDIKGIEGFIEQYGSHNNHSALKEEHRDVFDCADKITTEGHLLMMAAVQPFLSGAISKTINLPAYATIADVARVNERAWKLGLKAVAHYRDSCKLSQPLSGKKVDQVKTGRPIDLSQLPEGAGIEELRKLTGVSSEMRFVPDAEGNLTVRRIPVAGVGRGEKRKLPNPRGGKTYKVIVGGQTMYLRTGLYEDGSLGELFIDIADEGATLRSWVGCLAKAMSIGLQYGVPVSAFVKTFREVQFDPCGPVQEFEGIRTARSIPSCIARMLDALFPVGGTVTARPEPEVLHTTMGVDTDIKYGGFTDITDPTANLAVMSEAVEDAVRMGYLGEPCDNCHKYRLVRVGGSGCVVCKNCGITSGCS